jgi:TonB family protein
MSTIPVRSSDAASSRMLAVSACIHGICILALIVVSGSFHKPKTPGPQEIVRVTLKPTAPSPPLPEKAQQDQSVVSEPPLSDNQVELVEAPKPTEKKQAEVKAESLNAPKESIPEKKRKRPIKTVKAPKPPEKKPEKPVAKKPDKKPSEPVKKKEDADDYLKKQIAELAKGVEKKRSDAVAPRPQAGSGVVDKEALAWFAAVRTSINDSWSVFASYHHSDRLTVVGVQLANDGRLIDVTLDQSSGDEVLDRSALRAVHQASPFPPVPSQVADMIRREKGLAFRFSVKGMQ